MSVTTRGDVILSFGVGGVSLTLNPAAGLHQPNPSHVHDGFKSICHSKLKISCQSKDPEPGRMIHLIELL